MPQQLILTDMELAVLKGLCEAGADNKLLGQIFLWAGNSYITERSEELDDLDEAEHNAAIAKLHDEIWAAVKSVGDKLGVKLNEES